MPLFRRGEDRLPKKLDLGRKDGQLTGFGVSKRTVDSQKVSKVHFLKQGPVVVAHLAFPTENLDSAGPVPKVEENGFAGGPAKHHTAGDSSWGARWLMTCFIFWRNLRLQCPDFVDRLVAVKTLAPRVAAKCGDTLQLHSSHLFLIFTVGGRVAHCGPVFHPVRKFLQSVENHKKCHL